MGVGDGHQLQTDPQSRPGHLPGAPPDRLWGRKWCLLFSHNFCAMLYPNAYSRRRNEKKHFGSDYAQCFPGRPVADRPGAENSGQPACPCRRALSPWSNRRATAAGRSKACSTRVPSPAGPARTARPPTTSLSSKWSRRPCSSASSSTTPASTTRAPAPRT